ncbi:hypothetical protein ABZ078_15630 [Streptomyces sp. NPDC006385]
MLTQHELVDAEIDAWVAEQIEASPEWGADRVSLLHTYLGDVVPTVMGE